jgi:hypothetical protein
MTIEAWNEGVRLSWGPIAVVLTFLVYALFNERLQRKELKKLERSDDIESVRTKNDDETSTKRAA